MERLQIGVSLVAGAVALSSAPAYSEEWRREASIGREWRGSEEKLMQVTNDPGNANLPKLPWRRRMAKKL